MSEKYYPIYSTDLYHHGILGMHWGIRRYQPYPKGYTGDGKEVGQATKVQQRTGYFQQRKQKKEAANAEKQRLENIRKAREAAEAKRQHDADKERVLREGSATEVLRYQGELTNQELQNAVARLNFESQLRNISSKEMKRNMDRIDDIMKDVKTVTNWAKIGTETWNTIARIYNTTEEGKKNPWPLVTDGGNKQDEQSKKKNR